MSIVYDLELSELMLSEFKSIYELNNNEDVFKYYICRFVCSEIYNFNDIKKDIDDILSDLKYRKKIIDFTLNELDILTNLDFIKYNDVEIKKYESGSNSIVSCLNEFESICVDMFERKRIFNDINDILKKVYTKSKRKSVSKKKSSNYNHYLVYYAILELNSLFNIKEIKESSFAKYIDFEQSMPCITIEEKCVRYIDSLDYEYDDALQIDEDVLERYLYKNLNLIEEGLVPIKRQYMIRDGRIDILAKDKEGIYTIIELKVENDTDLIFQCIHYTSQLKLEKKVSKVRIITISPEYTYGILNSLKQISIDYNVESYVCLIKSKGIKHKKIDSIKLIKAI